MRQLIAVKYLQHYSANVVSEFLKSQILLLWVSSYWWMVESYLAGALDGSKSTRRQTKAINWKLQLLQWSVLYKWLLYNIISNCSFTYSLEFCAWLQSICFKWLESEISCLRCCGSCWISGRSKNLSVFRNIAKQMNWRFFFENLNNWIYFLICWGFADDCLFFFLFLLMHRQMRTEQYFFFSLIRSWLIKATALLNVTL